jgi:hypothetical protein
MVHVVVVVMRRRLDGSWLESSHDIVVPHADMARADIAAGFAVPTQGWHVAPDSRFPAGQEPKPGSQPCHRPRHGACKDGGSDPLNRQAGRLCASVQTLLEIGFGLNVSILPDRHSGARTSRLL